MAAPAATARPNLALLPSAPETLTGGLGELGVLGGLGVLGVEGGLLLLLLLTGGLAVG